MILPGDDDHQLIAAWAEHEAERIRAYTFDITRQIIPFEITRSASATDLRHFILSAFLADWACYQSEADRVDFWRLEHVITSFPEGFRVWQYPTLDGNVLPVGYSGWYPISQAIYDVLKNSPEIIKDRGFMQPISGSHDHNRYIYLFNFSIIKAFRKTAMSRQFMLSYAHDLMLKDCAGMAAVTVSDDGIRCVKRFGLYHTGDMEFLGEREGVYCGTPFQGG